MELRQLGPVDLAGPLRSAAVLERFFLSDVMVAQNGRVSHWIMDAAIGAVAAHAALPKKADAPTARASQLRGAIAAAEPAVPAYLISFHEPVRGYPVVSPFGLRQLPWEEHGRLHEGVDISAPSGVPVRVSADGVVSRFGNSSSYGRFVEVTHAAGLTTLYAHMGAIDPAITSGAALKAGAPVGQIGDSGTSTGPHLHFEVRDAKGRPLNPSRLLGHDFAKLEDLPLQEAARIPRGVRKAYVSRIPESKRLLMQAKLDAKDAKAGKAEKLASLTPMSRAEKIRLLRGRPTAQVGDFADASALVAMNAPHTAAARPDAAPRAPVVPPAPVAVTIPSLDGGAPAS
jgi:hypothetical protein